jgi:hypothetical protein
MANGKSDWQTALEAAANAKTGTPNRDNLGLVKRVARFIVTTLGNEVNGNYHILGTLQAKGARVVVEETRLRFTGSGTIDFKAQLKKVNTSGTAVSLSDPTARLQALTAAITLAPIAGTPIGDSVSLAADDELRLYFAYGTGTTEPTIPANVGIVVEVTYLSSAC